MNPVVHLPVGQAADLDAHVKVLFHRLDMGDGAHHATGCLQLVQRADGLLQRRGVERAETLVDEERFEPLTAGAATVADHVGQTER